MEVPLMVLVAVGEPVHVDRMDMPGAKTDESLAEDSRKISGALTINARTPVGEVGALITNG